MREGVPQIPTLNLPKISLEQKSSFDSRTSPIYYTAIFNDAHEEVGSVDYQLLHKDHKIIIQSVEISQQRKGYGKAVYKHIQNMYPDYTLTSSDSMVHKTNEDQEMPDAVRLWESLVKSDLAEKTDTGYKMKK